MNNAAKNPLSEENKFEKLKESPDDILIIGPSGSGKGYLAKLLHTESKERAGKLFIHVNSASVSSNLFESEMFGHIRGSFTGAIRNKEGYCSKVKDGDLFLDEIGDLPLDLQAKLLVLINDRIYMPVGSNEAKKFEGRIIAATNKNLRKEVASGKFREDLYYRLSNFVLSVKGLSEQKSKIPKLIELFLIEENAKMAFDDSALEYFSSQQWNGNIRQMRNVVKRIVRFSNEKKTIKKEDVIPYMEEELIFECEGEILENKDSYLLMKVLYSRVSGNLHAMIKMFVESALALNGGNITVTAKSISVGRKTLERMLKRYKILRKNSILMLSGG